MRYQLAAVLIIAAFGAAAAQPAWHTYSDAKGGFSISYPDGWTVNPDFVDRGYGFYKGDTDDVRGGIALKPPADLAPGTNLQSDQLALVVQTARPGDLCMAKSFLVDPSPDYVTQTTVDKPEVVRTVAEPGDRYGLEQVVLMAFKSPCIAVHYFVAYARPQPDDPHPAAQFDRKALFDLLGTIAATLRVPK